MALMDILQQYTGSAPIARTAFARGHFDEVARTAPPAILGQGVADAFRAKSTPPFADMVTRMFGNSNPQQQAGALNQLLHSFRPHARPALGGGIPARMLVSAPATDSAMTPQQASQVTAAQAQEIASQAERHDPGVLDRIAGFYADHPHLVRTLGSVALAIALAGVARRMRT